MISISAIFFASCQNSLVKETVTTVQFELNADSTQIVLKGLDHNIVQSMQEDSIAQGEFGSIYSIYPQAANEEIIGFEKPFPGKYVIRSGNLIFTPDSAFAKGQTYRAEFRMPEFYDQKDVVGKGLPGKVVVKERVFKF